MINEILQFIKKQKLAIHLARHNALFVIKGLKSFSGVMPLAKLFVVKNKLPHARCIENFLAAENNPILYAATDEIAARSDIVGKTLLYPYNQQTRTMHQEVLFKSIPLDSERKFWVELFREIVNKDFPQLKSQLSFFERRLDIILDLRFYGSELETLHENSANYESCCDFEIDWIKTNKHNLFLDFDGTCRFTQMLPKAAQENLVNLCAYLFYEQSLFISSFSGVSLDEKNQVSFLDFDYIYQAETTLKDFAAQYMQGKAPQPQSNNEYKLQRAFMLLKRYCPDVDIVAIWHNSGGSDSLTPRFAPTDELSYLKLMTDSGINLLYRDEIPDTNASSLAYLLDSSRHKKDPQYRKSSLLYAAPLFLLIYVLFKYF